MARVDLTFAPGTDPDLAWAKVQNKLQLAMASLPETVQQLDTWDGTALLVYSKPDAQKVRNLRAMIGDRPIHIEIDGGITPETAPLMAAAGADVLVAGSAVFKGGSVADPAPYGENIRAIRAAAEAT